MRTVFHFTRLLCLLLRSLIFGGVLFLLPSISHAQITLDGSLGPKGPLTGPNYAIDAKVGQVHGNNLFHSFGQFNVHTGESATFTGPATVENVIGRVTGGQQSLIDGQLRSEMPQANLYLLNPSGVLFGPNATLDVPGSFHVSTADYLRLADGEKFSANLSQGSVLTSAPPAAFGFLSGNPAAISIQGSTLKVPEGKTLSVVGGDIQVTGGSLSAPHGQINLASVASAGEVVPTSSEQGPDLKMEGFSRLGKIEASQGVHINTDSESGGSVLIRGGRLVVDNAVISSNTQGNTDGARVGVDAQITGDVSVTNDGRIESTAAGASNSGNTELKVKQLTLTDGARIDTSTSGDGHGGALSVTATDTISISGRSSKGVKSGLFSNALGKGDGGKVSVTASTLTMADRGTIDAHTVGDANAGNVDVQAGTLTLAGGAQIQAGSGLIEYKESVPTPSGTGGLGRGGNVTVNATDTISLSGGDSDGNPSGLFTNTVNKGDAGKLSVSAPLLQIDGGRISSSTLGAGNAGNLDVQVGQLTLAGGGRIVANVGERFIKDGLFAYIGTDSTGHGGNLTINATKSISIAGERDAGNYTTVIAASTVGKGDAGTLSVSAPVLLMRDEAAMSAGTLGDGNGGNSDVQVGKLTLIDGAVITTSVGTGQRKDGVLIPYGTGGPGRGGNITVHATESISISGQTSQGQSSAIGTTVVKGSGAGGNLFISTPELLLTATGSIISGTYGKGNSGDLRLEVGRLTADFGFLGSFNAGDGNAGNTEIQVGTLTISNGGGIYATAGSATPFDIAGPGRAGNITVIATDSISLSGRDSTGFPSGLFTFAFIGSGAGGHIFVSAPTLNLSDGGEISSASFPASTGNAGGIKLEVGKLTMSGDADIVTTTAGPGQGGNIQVQARQIELTNDKAAITASSSTSGNAGNITIHADDTFRGRNSSVSTESTQSGGGKIDLSAGHIVELVDSQITTSVQGGTGDAGNITIDPHYVILNDSQVIARAVEGDGGNINIGADVFIASPTSVVDASSQKGISGTVDIRGVVNNLSSSIAPLPQSYLSTAALVEDRCAGRRREGQVSSFVVTGRAGMPLQPAGILPSPLYEANAASVQDEPESDDKHQVVWQELPRITLDEKCKR